MAYPDTLTDEDGTFQSDASAQGIIQCLRMLAQEAGSLKLVRTVMAVVEAVAACEAELAAADSGRAEPLAILPAGTVLH